MPVIVHALAREGEHELLADALLKRTSSLGVRYHPVGRRILTRTFETITVLGVEIAVKLGRDHRGRIITAEPEFRDVTRLAHILGISEREALQRARASASEMV